MIHVDGLLGQIEKAWNAIKSNYPCETTTKAHLRLAEQETLNLIQTLRGHDLTDFRAARGWIIKAADEASSLKIKVYRMLRFWSGFRAGQREIDLPPKVGEYFEKGYNYGLYGSLE